MSLTSPTLSAVIANYNHASHLPEAIEGIVGQSRPPDELLVLDDASTDDSVAVIREYARRFPLLRLLQNERNLGVTESFNRLAREARGDYLYLGAADDRRLPEFFEQAMRLAEEHPQAGLVFGQSRIIDEAEQLLGELKVDAWTAPQFVSPQRFLDEYLERADPSHSICVSTVYRRAEFLEAGGYRRELGPWSDTFAARAVALKHGACYIPRAVTEWRCLDSSFSNAARQDPRRRLDIIDRAAHLMRSGEFRDRFPAEHVRRWRRRYRRRVVREHWWGTSAGLLRHPFTRWQRYRVQLPRTCAALRLWLYRPDLSCFAEGDESGGK